MALRWIDSFDGIHDDLHDQKYDPAQSVTLNQYGTPGRTGPRFLRLSPTYQLVTRALPVSGTTAIVGVAFHIVPEALESGVVTRDPIWIQEGGLKQMAIGVDYSPAYGDLFRFTVKRGSTVLGTSALFPSNSWLYLEFKTTIHATAGSYELRVDTVPVLTGSGVTSAGGSGVWDRVGLYGGINGAQSDYWYFDDLYICDGSGSTRNSFLGIQRVEPVWMKPGAGFHQGFTPSSGTDHGAMVDETIPDDDSTYNAAAAAAKDTYQHFDLTLPGVINGVQVNAAWRKTDAGTCTARALTRSGGTTYAGAIQSPLTTWIIQPEVLEVDPATGTDWTAAAFNAAEFGAERVT
jgi:hypothetical protein